MKTISNIDLNFNPMKIPKVTGRFGVDSISDKTFPLLITPKKVGTEIIIREGHVFTLSYPYMILNTQFRTRFKSLLKLTSEKQFTVHATVTCKGIEENKMGSILINPSSLLPINTELYVTLAFYEKTANITPFKDMVKLLEGHIGKSPNPFTLNIKPANYTEVPSKGKLLDILDFLFNKIKDIDGILLFNKNGSYKEGESNFSNADAAVLKPVEESWGTIQRVDTSLKCLPGSTVIMADEILIKFGETKLIYSLFNEPLMLRGYLAKQKETFVGTKILCELLFLSNKSTALITKILKLNK